MVDILSETFAIYGRNFWKFLLMVGVLQVPVSLLVLIPIEGATFSFVINFMSGITLMVVHAAVISAVGQHYVADGVSVGACYVRVTWRAVSLMLLALVWAMLTSVFLLLAESLVQVEEAEQTLAPLLLLPVTVGLMVFSIYMTTVTPAIIVQGYRSSAAVVRGYRLARRSEWRILGHLLSYSLVAFVLMVVIVLPFVFASGAAPEQGGTELSVPLLIGGLFVGVLVPPVISIATTLLYYDLRVRKEGYNLSLLSQEMGVRAT